MVGREERREVGGREEAEREVDGASWRAGRCEREGRKERREVEDGWWADGKEEGKEVGSWMGERERSRGECRVSLSLGNYKHA